LLDQALAKDTGLSLGALVNSRFADQRLHKEGRPRDAARIYTFLLQYAPGSPFADDMKRGLAEAEARIARAS